MSTAVLLYESFNPPTKSHREMFDKLQEVSKERGIESYIIPSSVSDNNTEPLRYFDKLNFLKQMFPDVDKLKQAPEEYIPSLRKSCEHLYKLGYKNIVIICQKSEYVPTRYIIETYNGKKTRNGYYKFESIDYVWCDDLEFTSRDSVNLVREGKIKEFNKTLPEKFDGRVLYEKIKLGLK